MVAEMAHIFLANAQDMPAPADEKERADYFTILVTRARPLHGEINVKDRRD